MKLIYFATVLSLLAVFHQAHAKEDTAVFYDDQDKSVSITDHTLCIPLENDGGAHVDFIVFGTNVECHTYSEKDCSGEPLEDAPLSFNAGTDTKQEEFGQAGAVKC